MGNQDRTRAKFKHFFNTSNSKEEDLFYIYKLGALFIFARCHKAQFSNF
jgi:hypothetical protein